MRDFCSIGLPTRCGFGFCEDTTKRVKYIFAFLMTYDFMTENYVSFAACRRASWEISWSAHFATRDSSGPGCCRANIPFVSPVCRKQCSQQANVSNLSSVIVFSLSVQPSARIFHNPDQRISFVSTCAAMLQIFPILFSCRHRRCRKAVISAVDCPECGLQVPLLTAGPDGIVDLPPNLYLDSLLKALQQDIACGAGDLRCSRCQTVSSGSLCQHCRQVGTEHYHIRGMSVLSARSCIRLFLAALYMYVDMNSGKVGSRRN
jgi:hypothetical protein